MNLLLVKDLFDIFVNSMVRNNLIDPSTGEFKQFYATEVAVVASDMETALKAHGLTVQPNLDKAIQSLPVILGMFGVK